MSMIKLNYNNMMSRALGKQGITDEQLDNLLPALRQAKIELEKRRGKQMQGWMLSPYNQDGVVNEILKTAAEVQSRCDAFVVLGIGGSSSICTTTNCPVPFANIPVCTSSTTSTPNV